ncbi:polyprenyl synthetase family protein [Crocinitomicaceae bacterium]|nr:polyprenyl synthetase family protein [Crocinitomicaceae bacterium]MDC1203725.1 polyprenyl synthetase family protein [Crocinitomicaceae bacterium]MDC1362371.1 polyprenyl synthetase family protein [Crocinitomicaceae bacterium]
MRSVEEIMKPVKSELNEFESHFEDALKSNVPLLDKVTHYIVKRKGKQMRPLFVFLSAKMLGEINEKTYSAASLVELLHTATLVHDDVVDDANERRGFFSVNALWKNKIAVLVGDYMLSKILLLSLEKDNTDLLGVVARSVKEMSEGELLQIEKSRTLDITEKEYFDVIRKKTASLISTCCEAGAISVDSDEERENMKMFGEKVGLAFQIKDDIFDYGSPNNIGKPTGIDIREQKLTLPLIYVLRNSPPKIQKELKRIIKNRNEESKMIKRATDLVIEHGGINYAFERMTQLADEAKELLMKYSESEAKRALTDLVNYTINREK